jgi:hypothetical protein
MKDLNNLEDIDVHSLTHTVDKVLEVLKTELATREDNDYNDGFGGNPSLLFFLITRPEIILRSNKTQSNMSIDQNGVLTITIAHSILHAENIKTRELRTILDNLYQHSEYVRPITQEQIANPSFLRDQGVKNRDIHLLIKCIEEARTLQARFQEKEPVRKAASVLFDIEIKKMKTSFLKEMGLPVDALDGDAKSSTQQQDRECDFLQDMLESHPIWGAKIDAISKRHSDIVAALVSEDDKQAIKFIDSFPGFAKVCALRTTLGIEIMVSYNLDEIGITNPL